MTKVAWFEEETFKPTPKVPNATQNVRKKETTVKEDGDVAPLAEYLSRMNRALGSIHSTT